MTKIVTHESLIELLKDESKRIHVIGRALTVLFNRQTEAEKSANTTQMNNTIGFSGSDAKSGTITAKYYLKHKTLLPWQVDNWMADFRGFPRICKYHRQLNEAAELKASVAERKPEAAPATGALKPYQQAVVDRLGAAKNITVMLPDRIGKAALIPFDENRGW